MKLKSKIAMLLLLFAAAIVLIVPGCAKVPASVMIDTDGDGKVDALALDADRDGVADLDGAGNPKILAGPKTQNIVDTADAFGPTILTVVGALAGGGSLGAILIAVAAAWKKAKFARIIMNLVMSVQAVRMKLADTPKMTAALEIVDEMLRTVQDPETEAMVREIKAAIMAAKAKG